MKYSKFCSISLERLVNHKPPISEEWHAFALCNEKEMMTFEDINYSKLFLKKQKLNKQKLGIMKIHSRRAGYDSMSWRLFSAVNYLHENLLWRKRKKNSIQLHRVPHLKMWNFQIGYLLLTFKRNIYYHVV